MIARVSLLITAFAAVFSTSITAFTPASSQSSTRWIGRTTKSSPSLKMAIDYNDPIVAEEFANVQPMTFEDVETELRAKGIPVPPTMK